MKNEVFQEDFQVFNECERLRGVLIYNKVILMCSRYSNCALWSHYTPSQWINKGGTSRHLGTYKINVCSHGYSQALAGSQFLLGPDLLILTQIESYCIIFSLKVFTFFGFVLYVYKYVSC